MSTNLSVTLHLQVFDEAAFRKAAAARALEDGLDEAEAKLFLDEDEKSLGECAIMLLDPGLSPAGCKILSSDTGV